ncbi:MAG TPA: methylenetetrahydrofolate reductase [Gammaproteobacteria bacterium]
MLSSDDLKQQIVAFVTNYSIEATPHDEENLAELAKTLQPGTAVYMAHLPGYAIGDIARICVKLQQHGLTAVPHVVSRKLESRDQLARALEEMARGGVREALVIAGDEAIPNAAFGSSLEVLETGLFDEYEFRAVGVAGHPEGSKAIGPATTEILLQKAELAKRARFDARVVTQFGFDPEAVTDWEAATSEAGIELPIHVGMAGPASLRQLVRFAMRCGIGSSARMMVTRTGATANLLRTHAPDELITHFARHRATTSPCRLEKAHFFCFGGVLKTAKWANDVIAGRFELNGRGTGFEVA